MNCDPLASTYRWWEYLAFGRQLQGCRTAFLDQIGGRRRALIPGEGDGRFLAQLLEQNPEIEVDCIDSSAKMIATARKRVQDRLDPERIRFHHRSVGSFEFAPDTYDLIVTHFFLDCFHQENLPELLTRMAQSGTRDVAWLLADFHQPPHGASRLRAKAWLSALYAFFGICTGLRVRKLSDPTPQLEQLGFHCARRVNRQWNLLKSELWVRRTA